MVQTGKTDDPENLLRFVPNLRAKTVMLHLKIKVKIALNESEPAEPWQQHHGNLIRLQIK